MNRRKRNLQPREIVEQFDEPIRRWFSRRVPRRQDAEDLAQETIIAAIEALPRFRGDSSPRTWVYAIARNQLLKYLRGVRRRPLPLPPDWDARATGADPAASGSDQPTAAHRTHGWPQGCPDITTAVYTEDRAADRITVQVIVSHLPIALREVYHLFYRDDLTTLEIARELQRSQGTVKYQLYEIRRRVKRAML